MDDKTVIECPHCGTEYLLGEIFIPQYILGKPQYVSRDNMGKILFVDGRPSDLHEDYVCDKCNKSFHIELSIDSKVTTKTIDMDDYVSKKYGDRLTLKED